MSGPGYSLPTGVPAQVTEKRGPPQLVGPQVLQSLAFGVHCTDFGNEGVFNVGHELVQAWQLPLLHDVSPLHVPHTPPQPSEPQDFPLQFGVHTAVQAAVSK